MIYGFSIWFLISCLLGVALLAGFIYIVYYYMKVSSAQKLRKERQAPSLAPKEAPTQGDEASAVSPAMVPEGGVFSNADIFSPSTSPSPLLQQAQPSAPAPRDDSMFDVPASNPPAPVKPRPRPEEEPSLQPAPIRKLEPENPFGEADSALDNPFDFYGDDEPEGQEFTENFTEEEESGSRLAYDDYETDLEETQQEQGFTGGEASPPPASADYEDDFLEQEEVPPMPSSPPAEDMWEESLWGSPAKDEVKVPQKPTSPYPSRKSLRNR